jgi:hypothetical protein
MADLTQAEAIDRARAIDAGSYDLLIGLTALFSLFGPGLHDDVPGPGAGGWTAPDGFGP